MKIIVLTNKMCHCVDVERELKVLGLDYEICDVEKNPGLAEQFHIRHCPTLIVDESRVIPIDEHNVTRLRQLLVTDW